MTHNGSWTAAKARRRAQGPGQHRSRKSVCRAAELWPVGRLVTQPRYAAVAFKAVQGEAVPYLILAGEGTPDGFWPQEDVAPFHSSKCGRGAKTQPGFKVLPWVGESPDMNPTEMLGTSFSAVCWRPQRAKGKDELFTALLEKGGAIADALLTSLVASMKR